MRLKFKSQLYQTAAVKAVMDCFAGQPAQSNSFRQNSDSNSSRQNGALEEELKNPNLILDEHQILENIQNTQHFQNLPVSQSLTDFMTINARGEQVPVSATYKHDALAATKFHLDVEMETGTGKTYCYIKTIFEMNRRYGWSKFIVMVPSVAIREGVYKSLSITAEHFAGIYGKKASFFIYNSKRLHELKSFAVDAGINVMIINIQAFNTRGSNRRIYEELDEFQSQSPIGMIAATRPILILDEPQKMEGSSTVKTLPKFNPLMILRYSATHRTQHNQIYHLDALDAYNQKLVKKIAVLGIKMRGLIGTSAYLYLEGIDISRKSPVARIEFEMKLKSGEIKRQLRKFAFQDDLFTISGRLEQYRGFVISQIDYARNMIEFANGMTLNAGEAYGDISEQDIRRIQIRETINAHLNKERQLFSQGVKVLSLFFIDEVAKYRDYDREDVKGDYARTFEEEYEQLKGEHLSQLTNDNKAYHKYLEGIEVTKTHNGYFSIDKKSKRMKNPDVNSRSIDSDDVDAYDLILKDKERLLSLEEPTRFIFSHSALREGWDNPNVFVICMLKHTDNTISRRQEVGRGLRLSVNQHGNRMDHFAVVHDINVLTVVASESYQHFVSSLQKEITESLSSRPQQATEAYFTGKLLYTDGGSIRITAGMAAGIEYYLIRNGYVDKHRNIVDKYHDDKNLGALADLPDDLKLYQDQIFRLIESIFSGVKSLKINDGRSPRTNPLNDNFGKKEFQEFWSRFNRKAVYRVEFDSQELIEKCVEKINELQVASLRYLVQTGVQTEALTVGQLRSGDGFMMTNIASERGHSPPSQTKYDLIGKIEENTQLTRKTIANVLSRIAPSSFNQFGQNPEYFISEISRIIIEQKASMIIEHITYDEIQDKYVADIFAASQIGQDFSRATEKLRNHIYDYAIVDSDIERNFVRDLDISDEIVVYAKLPRGILIPTPVGDYNPDWAICFRNGRVRHIYFVAETKGSMSSLQLRGIEKIKIECARKFFEEINTSITKDRLKFDVITDYNKLMDVVGGPMKSLRRES